MGHYCRMCGRMRPNERFSGHGHKVHICKQCQKLPKAERDRRDALDELDGFAAQSNISQKNIKRLHQLCESADTEVRNQASLLLEIARVKPHKRRRLKYLAQNKPDLFKRFVQTFAIDPDYWISLTDEDDYLDMEQWDLEGDWPFDDNQEAVASQVPTDEDLEEIPF